MIQRVPRHGVFATLLAVAALSPSIASADWTMYAGNPQHTGISTTQGRA